MNREAIEVGPAKWTFNTKSFYTKSNASIRFPERLFPITGDLTGHIDDRMLGHNAEVSLVPDGRLNADLISIYWPMLTKQPGTSLFSGSAATPLVALPTDGKGAHTVADAAVAQMPNLILSSNQDMVGQIGFRGVYAYSKGPATASALYTVGSTAAFAVDTAFAQTDFHQGTYLATWGSGSFTTIESHNGWTVSFRVETKDIVIDGALRDILFMGVSVLVKGIPANAASSTLSALALIPGATGVVLGASAAAAGQLLTISGGGITLSLPKAMMVTAGFEFGSDVLRQGEIGFVAHKTFTAGVIDSTWCAITVA